MTELFIIKYYGEILSIPLVEKWLNKWRYSHTVKLHRRITVSALALSIATDKFLQMFAE